MTSVATPNLTDMLSQSQPAFLHVYSKRPFHPAPAHRQMQDCTTGSVPCLTHCFPSISEPLKLKTGGTIRMTLWMSGVISSLPLQWKRWEVSQRGKLLLKITCSWTTFTPELAGCKEELWFSSCFTQGSVYPRGIDGPGQSSGEQRHHQEEGSVHYKGSESRPL